MMPSGQPTSTRGVTVTALRRYTDHITSYVMSYESYHNILISRVILFQFLFVSRLSNRIQKVSTTAAAFQFDFGWLPVPGSSSLGSTDCQGVLWQSCQLGLSLVTLC